jgi:hypothetical protein
MASNASKAPATGGSNAVKMIAPFAAMGATWGVRKVLDSAYRKKTGKEPPHARNPDTSMMKVIAWAAVTAATLAVVQVIIDRFSVTVSSEVLDAEQ